MPCADISENELTDYKFYCFQGEPVYCQVIKNRSREETIDFFDMEWNHLEFTGLSLPDKPFNNAPTLVSMSDCFGDMKEKALVLAEDKPFVRIDFYEVRGKAYFGEITFYTASGFGVFTPDKWNYIMGNMIQTI